MMARSRSRSPVGHDRQQAVVGEFDKRGRDFFRILAGFFRGSAIRENTTFHCLLTSQEAIRTGRGKRRDLVHHEEK